MSTGPPVVVLLLLTVTSARLTRESKCSIVWYWDITFDLPPRTFTARRRICAYADVSETRLVYYRPLDPMSILDWHQTAIIIYAPVRRHLVGNNWKVRLAVSYIIRVNSGIILDEMADRMCPLPLAFSRFVIVRGSRAITGNETYYVDHGSLSRAPILIAIITRNIDVTVAFIVNFDSYFVLIPYGLKTTNDNLRDCLRYIFKTY